MMTIPTESQEQCTLITWCEHNQHIHPELEWIMHVPNGGQRNPREAARLKREGVNPGFPDLFLPVPRKGHHGLMIEMKRKTGGVVSKDQKDWINHLTANGYRAVVCKGWEQARAELLDYLAPAA